VRGIGRQRMLTASHGAIDRHARSAAVGRLELDRHFLSVEGVPEHDEKRPLDEGPVFELAGAAFNAAKPDRRGGFGKSVWRGLGPRLEIRSVRAER